MSEWIPQTVLSNRQPVFLIHNQLKSNIRLKSICFTKHCVFFRGVTKQKDRGCYTWSFLLGPHCWVLIGWFLCGCVFLLLGGASPTTVTRWDQKCWRGFRTWQRRVVKWWNFFIHSLVQSVSLNVFLSILIFKAMLTVDLVSWGQKSDVCEGDPSSVSIIKLHHHAALLLLLTRTS